MQVTPRLLAGAVGLGATTLAAGAAYNHIDRQRLAGDTTPSKGLGLAVLGSGSLLGLGVKLAVDARLRRVGVDDVAAATQLVEVGSGLRTGVSLGPIAAYGGYNAFFDVDGGPNLLDPVGNVQRRLDRSDRIGDDG